MSIFKKLFGSLLPAKIEDEYFGVLEYNEFSYAGLDTVKFYRGEVFFKPVNEKIGITFSADKSGPQPYQKELFKQVEEKYPLLANAAKTTLSDDANKEYLAKKEVDTIDVINDYKLVSIGINKKDGDAFSWDFQYMHKKNEDIEITVYFVNFEVNEVEIDNFALEDDEEDEE